MKLTINIQNRYMFWTLMVLISAILIGAAIAVYDPAKGSHDTLWTNTIESKTGAAIIISGDAEVTGDLTVNGKLSAADPTAIQLCNWEGWQGGTSKPSSHDCRYECTVYDFPRLKCESGKVVDSDFNGCRSWRNLGCHK